MTETSHLSLPDQWRRPTPENEPSGSLAESLDHAADALEVALGDDASLLGRLRALRRRLADERLQIAVLGQFKRGKSTFINALLGAAVLPTGVIPLTAVATFITWRATPGIVVRFKDRVTAQFDPETAEEIRDTLFRFVAEQGNPENHLGVVRVDLFYPADVLADGTVLIDTPGVGSTLRHNTEAALDVLPECDAAFFVVSADPPITEVELTYLRQLSARTTRLFFVLNKADYLQEAERHAALEFLQKVLAQASFVAPAPRIFCISARDGLAAKQNGNGQMLAMSGIAALEERLVRLLAGEKKHWLEAAVRNQAADILTLAVTELSLRERTLNMPIEELATKSAAFQDALVSIENERRVTRDLVVGEHRRLRQALDLRIEQLRDEIAAKLFSVITASLSGAEPGMWEQTARHALSTAMQAEFETARIQLASTFASEAAAALRGCQDRIDRLVDRVRRTAAQIFDVPLGADPQHDAFALGGEPYWITESVHASLIPDPSRLIDRLLPATLRRNRLRVRLIRQAGELIVRNGENLRWAILRGLDETFRKAAARFEERLDDAIGATRNVIQDALARRRDRSFAARPELDRLADARAVLAAAREELRGG